MLLNIVGRTVLLACVTKTENISALEISMIELQFKLVNQYYIMTTDPIIHQFTSNAPLLNLFMVCKHEKKDSPMPLSLSGMSCLSSENSVAKLSNLNFLLLFIISYVVKDDVVVVLVLVVSYSYSSANLFETRSDRNQQVYGVNIDWRGSVVARGGRTCSAPVISCSPVRTSGKFRV